MNESFFLTRQTANLMEDFDKELKADPALYLLYGETRVGKSRLLQELIKTRLGDRRVHGIELRSGAKDGKGKQDRSVEIEKTFASARPGDIIVADHFESALKKTRHQLLVSWSTDGVDKELQMIICSNLEGFNELRELALRYHVSARSFRLKPLAPDEIEAFFAFYLFRDELVGKLNIPQYLHKQISQSGGVIGDLIDIAIRDGDQIENIPLRELESAGQKRWILGTVVSVVLLGFGFGWYYYSGPDSFDTTASEPVQPDFSEILAQSDVGEPGLTQEEVAFEPEPEATNAPVPQAEPEAAVAPANGGGSENLAQAEPVADTAAMSETGEMEAGSEVVPETDELEAESEEEIESLAEAEQAEPEQEIDPLAEAEQAEPVIEAENTAQSDPAAAGAGEAADTTAGTAIETLAAEDTVAADATPPAGSAENPQTVGDSAAEAEAAGASDTAGAESTQTASVESEPLGIEARFERDLQASLDWLDNRPAATGMVQIMLLNVSGFDLRKYYDFIDRLQNNGVDTSRVRIFETMTGKRRTYSVFYEEFITRRAAMRGIPLLPKIIQDTSPIPRSVGGLWDEIRRLEANN